MKDWNWVDAIRLNRKRQGGPGSCDRGQGCIDLGRSVRGSQEKPTRNEGDPASTRSTYRTEASRARTRRPLRVVHRTQRETPIGAPIAPRTVALRTPPKNRIRSSSIAACVGSGFPSRGEVVRRGRLARRHWTSKPSRTQSPTLYSAFRNWRSPASILRPGLPNHFAPGVRAREQHGG